MQILQKLRDVSKVEPWEKWRLKLFNRKSSYNSQMRFIPLKNCIYVRKLCLVLPPLQWEKIKNEDKDKKPSLPRHGKICGRRKAVSFVIPILLRLLCSNHVNTSEHHSLKSSQKVKVCLIRVTPIWIFKLLKFMFNLFFKL